MKRAILALRACATWLLLNAAISACPPGIVRDLLLLHLHAWHDSLKVRT